jgi:hypothetical protein
VLLPGFQKGRDQFWPKFVSYKEKLEKWTDFTTFNLLQKQPKTELLGLHDAIQAYLG